MSISNFNHSDSGGGEDPRINRKWATKEDIESLRRDIEEIKDGLKRNFIRNDKLEKEVGVQQEKSITAMKGIVDYVDIQIQTLKE
jgi:hypothetical protein